MSGRNSRSSSRSSTPKPRGRGSDHSSSSSHHEQQRAQSPRPIEYPRESPRNSRGSSPKSSSRTSVKSEIRHSPGESPRNPPGERVRSASPRERDVSPSPARRASPEPTRNYRDQQRTPTTSPEPTPRAQPSSQRPQTEPKPRPSPRPSTTPRTTRYRPSTTGRIKRQQSEQRPTTWGQAKQPWGTIIYPPHFHRKKLTEAEIEDSVERLTKPFRAREPYVVRPKTPKMQKEEADAVFERLSSAKISSRVAESVRTQTASQYRPMGIVNSFAWKGWN